MFRLLNKR